MFRAYNYKGKYKQANVFFVIFVTLIFDVKPLKIIIMNIKKFFGLLMICAVAIFAFTACSSDDDDEKTGTFEYAIGYPSFAGNFEGMQKISDAFKQAFGVTEKSFKLTGTQSECNRKAKEYALKAQAALANEGSFDATIKFVNVTTGELIHSFTIKMDDNQKPKNGIKYMVRNGNVTFYDLTGCRIQIVSNIGKDFDLIISKDEVTINLSSMLPTRLKSYVFNVTVWDENGIEKGSFNIYYARGNWA